LKKYARSSVFAGVLLLGTLLPVAAEKPVGFRFVPAHTRVGLARVTLLVSDVAYRGGRLTGSYEVRIPLAPWRNDRGEMRLDIREPLERLLASGKAVTGLSHSVENGRVHPVTCSFEADGTVHITIETDERTLAFTTHLADPS
jgi:hypothetical protein